MRAARRIARQASPADALQSAPATPPADLDQRRQFLRRVFAVAVPAWVEVARRG